MHRPAPADRARIGRARRSDPVTRSDRPVRVCIYRGLGRAAEKSGVGVAMRQQEAMLDRLDARRVGLFERPDIVQINTIFADSLVAGALGRLGGARVVSFAHSTRQDFENSWAGANAVAPLFDAWLGLVYRVGHVVVTPTPYSRSLIEKYRLRRPVHVLTNGVDTEFFAGGPQAAERFRARYGLTSTDRVVVSVGHLMARKGIVEFVELAERMPEVRFFWFGHTPRAVMTADVRQAVDSAPENLVFAGYVPRDQVRDAYAGADVFSFMTHEETEGIVVLEALASGTHVLVRDIPVYDDWLPEGEVVHKARSTHEFEATIRSILGGEAADLTEAARAHARGHDLGSVAARLRGIYGGVGQARPSMARRLRVARRSRAALVAARSRRVRRRGAGHARSGRP